MILIGVALVLLLAGWFLMKQGAARQGEAGLPVGRLIYADTHSRDWQPTDKPLYSAAHNLVGKPDYIVETKKGLIPVEVKSGRTPEVPYFGHILQLAAYCLLIEETSGQTPPHGLLKYSDALYEVDFTRELRRELLDTLADMRQTRQFDDVARNHNQPGKCAACGFKTGCGDALLGN